MRPRLPGRNAVRKSGGHGGRVGTASAYSLPPELYVSIEHSAKELAAEMCAAAAAHGTDVSINQIGSLIAPFFTPNGVTTFVDAKGSDVGRYAVTSEGCWSAASILRRPV